MSEIRLGKDGLLTCSQKTVGSDPLIYLGYKIEVEAGASLRSFFQMLERYEPLTHLNPFLSAYMIQYRLCTDRGCRLDGVDHIELHKTIEMIGFPGEPRVETYVSLLGRREGATVDLQAFWIDMLLDVEVRLGKLSHVVFGDTVDTFEYDTVFNLFELVDGIAWQLSFHNMPAECKITLKEAP